MLYLLGLNHRSAPVEVRERLHFPPDELTRVLPELASDPGLSEVMIVSTCNRTEVITAARGPEEAEQSIRAFVQSRRPAEVEALDRHGYRLVEMEAARHIFRVASSLDSMVVGEPQILGQVKTAYATAQEAGTVGPAISGLMQRAFSCAKRIRTDTDIARNPVSIAYAAAELAEKIFGSLEGRPIMVLGAGEMGALTARHLIKKGVDPVLVANRTYQAAADLARELSAEAVSFDRYMEYLSRTDVVIVSTAAPDYILKAEHSSAIMKARKRRPLFLVDVAVPRNVDPALNEVNNIFLYNVDDLQAVADSGMEERQKEAARAESLVEEELEGYEGWLRTVSIQPTIVALRSRFHGMAVGEVRRHRTRLGSLSDQQEEAVRNLVEGVVNKLLHCPTVELKRGLRNNDGFELLTAARRLFHLEDMQATLPRQGKAGGESAGKAGDENKDEGRRGRGSPKPPDGTEPR